MKVDVKESLNHLLGDLHRVELLYLGLDFVHYAIEKGKMVLQ